METSRTNAQCKRNDRYNLLYEIELILSVPWTSLARQTRQTPQIQRYGNQALWSFTVSILTLTSFSKSCCGTISKAGERDKRWWHRNGVATFIAKKSEFLKKKWLIYSLSRTTGEIYLSGGSSNEKSQTITLPIIFLKLIWLLHHEGTTNEWLAGLPLSFLFSTIETLELRLSSVS